MLRLSLLLLGIGLVAILLIVNGVGNFGASSDVPALLLGSLVMACVPAGLILFLGYLLTSRGKASRDGWMERNQRRPVA